MTSLPAPVLVRMPFDPDFFTALSSVSVTPEGTSIVPPLARRLTGFEPVIVLLTASVPPFIVITLLALPNAPYSTPLPLASDETVTLPPFNIVEPVYLLVLLMFTLPVPSKESVALPPMALPLSV